MHGNSRKTAAPILNVHSDFSKIISEKKMIIFLLSVLISRNLHKNKNFAHLREVFLLKSPKNFVARYFFFMYIQILAKLFLKKNYDHIFAKRVVFLL